MRGGVLNQLMSRQCWELNQPSETRTWTLFDGHSLTLTTWLGFYPRWPQLLNQQSLFVQLGLSKLVDSRFRQLWAAMSESSITLSLLSCLLLHRPIIPKKDPTNKKKISSRPLKADKYRGKRRTGDRSHMTRKQVTPDCLSHPESVHVWTSSPGMMSRICWKCVRGGLFGRLENRCHLHDSVIGPHKPGSIEPDGLWANAWSLRSERLTCGGRLTGSPWPNSPTEL